MKALIYTIVLLITQISAVQAVQVYTISGVVRDAQRKAVIAATVFIDGSKKITKTDAQGEFQFAGIEPGTYQLVVNMIGFYSSKQTLIVRDKNMPVEVILRQKEEMLKEVVIAFDSRRTENLKLFKKQFLGTSANAAACKIMNDDVLTFKNPINATHFEAFSDDFIIINNQKLGYKIKYLLRKFVHNKINGVTSYDGEVIFENLEGSEKEQAKWTNNRKLAYRGSLMHYMRSLFQNNTVAQNFVTYQKASGTTLVNVNDFVKPLDSNFIELKYKHPLYIRYDENAREQYSGNPKRLDAQTGNDGTLLRLYLPEAVIDKKGSYVDYKSFLVKGYWGGKRIGDQLPFEYQE